MVNKVIKSLINLVLSVFSLYFLGGTMPKIIGYLSSGYEKTYLIAFYWIGILSVLCLPQYWVWFTDEDLEILAPVKSLGSFIVSILAVAMVTLMTSSITSKITLSATSGMIYTVCFWLFAILIMYVPQVFVYEPLKERFT